MGSHAEDENDGRKAVKEGLLTEPKAESPGWYERCMNDETCGK